MSPRIGLDVLKEDSRLAWFFARYGRHLVVGALMGAFAQMLFMCEHDAHFSYAFERALPLLALPAVAIVWRIHAPLSHRFGRARFWLGLVLLVPTLCLLLGAWVVVINGIVPPRRDIALAGVVQRKFIAGSKAPRNRMVELRTQAGVRTLEVSQVDYDSAAEGSTFVYRGKVGCLGLVYAPKYDWLPD